MGGAPQLVNIGGDVDNHQRECLCEAGNRAGPCKVIMDGTSVSGGVEGGQADAGGGGGKRRGSDFYR